MAKTNYADSRHVDLIDGDKDSIHIPSMIQQHGAMIVIKEPELTILQVSSNTGSHFNFTPEELLNQPLAMLLGEVEVEQLRSRFLPKNLEAAPHYLPAVRIGKEGKIFELLLHRNQGLLILECEQQPGEAITQQELYPSVNSAIAQMQRAGSVLESCQIAATEVRRFTGFDRVMIHKFNDDGSGDVIAESQDGGFESCLGLRYPASDATQQAWGLYLKSWLRMEVDVRDQSFSLIPPINPLTNEPLDMSHAVTRGISPAHLGRLRTMGATASMSISILKNDRLWGVIACNHHAGPKYAQHATRMACECLAHFLSLQVAANEDVGNHEYLRKAEEMAKLNAELERSNIELDSFAYMASHDLKEPLRGINNYSHFLIEDYADKLDEAGVEKLQTLITLTMRMEALVDSLLYYSRVGRADLARREVDLNEVVGKTLEMIGPLLRESGAEIRCPRRLPVVEADHALVGEIFHNLIVNAIKYNDKPLKWVEIGFEERAGDKETGGGEERESPHSAVRIPHPVVFYVRDNGIGIHESHHETIFGIFKRLHGREEFGGGVGAGLTIVKKIVESHNGRIWVESRVGEGSTFYFTLC